MKLFELLEYAQKEAEIADFAAHDMEHDGDLFRNMQWSRAVAFYEMCEKIKSCLGLDDK